MRRPVDQGSELRHRVIPMVVPPRELVQVPLQPLAADGVVRPTNAVLHQREETVNRLGVDVAVNVDALLMVIRWCVYRRCVRS